MAKHTHTHTQILSPVDQINMHHSHKSTMENIQSQPDQGVETSEEQETLEEFHTHRHSPSQKFQQAGAGSWIPQHKVTLLLLGLLNAVLLITAVVLTIYCANANEDHLLTPHSAVSSLIIERNYLRNHSNIIKAWKDAEEALVREKTSQVQLKLQLKQQTKLGDTFRSQIEILQKEKAELEATKAITEQNCGRCPSGWTLLKSTCYYFSLPEPNAKKNWQDSRADCIGRGGDLLVIKNLQEQTLISDNIPKASSSSGLWWQNGFWMGLQDTESRGKWTWINNTTAIETGYWRNNQPTTIGLQTGHCAAFIYFTDATKTWYNGNCQDHLYNWICEMETKPFE
ncbi:C-type lectin domain family 4 member G-like isoform X2 [Hippocampus zosterae]|uniref:C-type lectin domain family 4 member G-like isoform X2 n=1 Tax=Hippocampus zosterae TaxID=109293 RepID=UPI00223CAC16|nr:C-type lectin domain family 4 member G-like isoform X2 [Hippocampus zosterae]